MNGSNFDVPFTFDWAPSSGQNVILINTLVKIEYLQN